jgi:hypothetical protein
MPNVELDPLYGIRATRAEPPGMAGEDDRRAVYGTALTQFEELMRAAVDASAQTRPLTLFYALSQAGRAIAAAHLKDAWELKGHGLEAKNLDAADLAEVRVRPKTGKADSFAGVAAATGSEPLKGSVAVVELWASLPSLTRLIPEGKLSHPGPVNAYVTGDPMSNLRDFRWVPVGLGPLAADNLEEAREALDRYRPGRAAEVIPHPAGGKPEKALTIYGEGFQVRWPNPTQDFPGEQQLLGEVAPLDALTGDSWMRPELSDGSSPSELTTWWALLYSLSMLARYQPAAWFRSLDYDASPWAAPLTELLRIGTDAVPRLVLSALYGGPTR